MEFTLISLSMFFHLILEANVQNNQEKARVKQNKLIFHELKWPPLHLEIHAFTVFYSSVLRQ